MEDVAVLLSRMVEWRVSLPLALFCAALFLLSAFFLLLHRHSTSQIPIPPGTRGLPLLGETLDYQNCLRANQAALFVTSRIARYGEIFRTSLYFSPTIVLHGAGANRLLYSSEGKLVKEAWPTSLTGLLGRNTLVAQSGVQHKRLRRLVMTCLYPEALQKIMAKVDLLTQQHFEQHWKGRDQLSLFKAVKSHALKVASVVLVGIEDPERQEELVKLFYIFIAGLMRLPIYLPWTRYYQAHVARVELTKMMDDVISRRREMQGGNSTELMDLIDILIFATDENGSSLTRTEIHDLLITLLFAGHDTIASTIFLASKFLCENPACLNEVLKEQTAIAESQKPGEKLSWGDLLKMKYTWAVMQETLRMQPAVQGTFYVAIKDFEFGGFKIPRGWKIYQSLASCHLDERNFSEPLKFDPSRFLQTAPPPYAFHPFGGGPHVCPGMDFARMVMLVFFHHLVTRYDWTLVNAEEQVCIDPMPFPVDGLPIKLEERRL